MDKLIYEWIIEVEMMIFMRYKIDPFAMESKWSMWDMRAFEKILEGKVTEEQNEQKKHQTKDNLMKSLIAIRDILNYMTYKDNPK